MYTFKFVWVGRTTQLDDRKAAPQAAEEFITSNNRPKATHNRENIAENGGKESGNMNGQSELCFISCGSTEATTGGGPKGKEKKNVPVTEEIVPPLLNSNGKLEVRSLDGGGKDSIEEDQNTACEECSKGL
ncbi:villin headpiece, Villin/Gelsolin, ADF-H/Gelsolin-like domain protein [Artemisia annua]|uniref:Villin headpiece, Villin/Gelsolin, ADF-H/Gelsolin-like domain protein n=1 Tax=Artemisia annua TaxID=35608 RepID=A0A2U1LBL5_ARTAN|nr:villin headpiece, Villin/Gelsolin, ADF-H/Gelsolin-like domain protein [Artemisia annua]